MAISLEYEGTDCARGNHSLNLLQWMHQTSALSDAALEELSSGSSRLSDFDSIQAHIVSMTNKATCLYM